MTALLGFVALLLSFAGYAGTLDGYFVGDDFAHLSRYHDFPLREWPSLFTRGWVDNLWSRELRELRPVNALSFMIDARVWGVNPFGFRLTNVLLHATCAMLVGLVGWQVSQRRLACALTATVIFALHPVNAHGVTWISGRVDPLVTSFYLAALLAFLRFRERDEGGAGWLAAGAFFFAAAAFTKEFAFTFPPLLLAADVVLYRRAARWRERRTWLPHLVVAAVFASYLLCRRVAFGIGGPGGVGNWPDPMTAEFWATFAWRQAAYLAHLLPPFPAWQASWRQNGWTLDSASLATLAVFVLLGAILVF